MEKMKKALLEARTKRESIRSASALASEDMQHEAIELSAYHLHQDSTQQSFDDVVTESHRITVNEHILESNKVLCSKTSVPVQRAYKMLRTRFLKRMQEHGWNTIAMISPATHDGKTLTAINLAMSIAEDPNHTALLVDFDLLRPGIARHFEYTPDLSVIDCLTKDVSVAETLVRLEERDFVFAPSKDSIQGSSELLASSSAAQFASELKQKYSDRVVIYDLPPLLMCDDALAFLPNVDAVMIVLREGKTKRSELETTMELLEGKPIVGIVLNDSQDAVVDGYY